MPAIAISALSSLLWLGLAIVAADAAWRSATRPPELVVANGTEAPLTLRIDGRDIARVEPRRHHRVQVSAGEHELCAIGAGGEAPACARRLFEVRSATLWSPGAAARFLELAAGADGGMRLVPRSEWLDVSGYDSVLDPPIEPSPMTGGEVRILAWGRSDPVLIAVDNPWRDPIAFEIDGASSSVAPMSAEPRWAREGEHRVRVLHGGEVVFDRTLRLADAGAYLLDPSGTGAYHRCVDSYASLDAAQLVPFAGLLGADLFGGEGYGGDRYEDYDDYDDDEGYDGYGDVAPARTDVPMRASSWHDVGGVHFVLGPELFVLGSARASGSLAWIARSGTSCDDALE